MALVRKASEMEKNHNSLDVFVMLCIFIIIFEGHTDRQAEQQTDRQTKQKLRNRMIRDL